jgi:hypothetical protein
MDRDAKRELAKAPVEELLRRAGLAKEVDPGLRAQRIPMLVELLGAAGRVFVTAWWHADDLDAVEEVLAASLATHGIEPLPGAKLEAATEALEEKGIDEDDIRRHQIGLAARHANRGLERAGRSERVRAFDEKNSGESDEPLWLWVSPEEHAALLPLLGSPEGLEAELDDPSRSDPVAAARPPRGPAIPKMPYLALGLAQAELVAGRFETALAAALVGSRDHGHGMLAELIRIEALIGLGRREEAARVWGEIADGWLKGARQIWDTQWAKLAALHQQLGLPEGAVIDEVRARR